MPKTTSKSVDFEASLSELQSIVESMENDNLPLEQALEKFERGIGLTKSCQKALDDAEQKIRRMTTDDQSA